MSRINDFSSFSYLPEKMKKEPLRIKTSATSLHHVNQEGRFELDRYVSIKPNEDSFGLIDGSKEAIDSTLGHYRIQQVTAKAVVLGRGALSFIRHEGVKIPGAIAKVSAAVQGAMSFGAFIKVYADIVEAKKTFFSNWNCGEKLAKAYKEETNESISLTLDPKAPPRVTLEAKSKYEKLLSKTFGKIPVFGLNMQKYLAAKEVRKLHQYESHDINTADKVIEVAGSVATVVSMTGALFGFVSLPVLGTVLSTLLFASTIRDATISGKVLMNASKLNRESLDGAVDEAMGVDEADALELLRDDRAMETIAKMTPKEMAVCRFHAKIKLMLESHGVDKARLPIDQVDKVIREKIQARINAGQQDLPENFSSMGLEALIDAHGNLQPDQVNRKIYSLVRGEIEAEFKNRVSSLRRDMRIAHGLNMIKVGCAAMPLILSVGAFFYPPLAVAAGAASFVAVAIVVTKLLHSKFVNYKAKEEIELFNNGRSCGVVDELKFS